MTEIIAFFTVLKTLGFDLAKIIEICFIILVVLVGISIILWRVWRFANPHITKFFDEVKGAVDGAKAAAKSVEDLNNTLKTYMINNDKKLIEGNQKFEEHSKEIRMLAKQIASFAEHIRFLYTRAQLEPPTMAGDEAEQQQLRDNYPPKE